MYDSLVFRINLLLKVALFYIIYNCIHKEILCFTFMFMKEILCLSGVLHLCLFVSNDFAISTSRPFNSFS